MQPGRHTGCAKLGLPTADKVVMASAAILVVDDEWEQGKIMMFLLEDAGYNARYAPNGRAALRSLDDFPAALVITDYMMPIMDGCLLLQAMRGIASLASTPTLMVSALSERGHTEKVQACGGIS